MAFPSFFGTETIVSTQNSNVQTESAVTVLADGRIAVVWFDQGVNAGDVKYRILNADGSVAITERTANYTTAGLQGAPDVVGLASGNFAIVWQDFSTDGSGNIRHAIVDAAGERANASDKTSTADAGYQQAPTLAATPDGFVIGWNDGNTSTTGLNGSTAAMARQVSAGGSLVGAPIRISGDFGGDFGPAIASDGDLLGFVWDDDGGPNTNQIAEDGIYFTGSTGFPLAPGTGGVRVDAGTFREASRNPDIAISGTDVAIVFDDVTTGSTGRDIYFRATGVPTVRINTTVAGDQARASITDLAFGGWAVVWADAQTGDVRARIIDRDGIPVDTDFLVTPAGIASEIESAPDVQGLIDGRFVVTWSDSSGAGTIQARILDPRTSPVDWMGGDPGEQFWATDFGNDLLSGGGGADLIFGQGGNDSFFSSAGADSLDGGAGRDTVSYASSTVGISVTLNRAAAAVVTLGGVADDVLRNIESVNGSRAGDKITGDLSANSLRGLGGNDTLNGGLGKDVLRGDGGADSFDFTTTLNGVTNVDTIAGFLSGVDRIGLSAGIFSALGPTITANELRFGTAALDSNDRLVYDAATGTLSYDADAKGGGLATAFAILGVGTSLVFSDLAIL